MPTSGAPTPPAALGPPSGPAAGHAGERLGVAGLLRTPGYSRLLAVRFSAQFSDGMFQAALGGAVLFNPEREADPLAVAAGLAVLLLPYSMVGPFAGALLDRWDRRRVLFAASLLRAALIVVVAVTVHAGVAGLPLYLGALAVAGLSRFLGSGLSVALPHVVPRRHLVEANTFAVTLGSAMTAAGGAAAIGLRAVFGADDAGSAVTTLTTLVGGVLAAALATGFPRGALGPDRAVAQRGALSTVLHGFVDGARATRSTPTVAASFLALAAHRLAFGTTTLLMLLLFRHAFTDSGPLRAGLAGIGEAVVLAALGLGVAALLTPWAVRRWGRPPTVRAALLLAAATQLAVALALTLPVVLAAAFVLGLAGQVLKLTADAAVQSEVGDGLLGRVFALYDMVFNVGYVAAVAVAALLSPPDGMAPWLLGGAAGLYVLGLLAHDAQLRRTARLARPGDRAARRRKRRRRAEETAGGPGENQEPTS